jgi:hypothetical protein
MRKAILLTRNRTREEKDSYYTGTGMTDDMQPAIQCPARIDLLENGTGIETPKPRKRLARAKAGVSTKSESLTPQDQQKVPKPKYEATALQAHPNIL